MAPEEERKIFAKRLEELREERGWTQSDLARKAGLTPSAISQFESEGREPRFSSIVKLAHALEASPAYLAGLEEYETENEEMRALLRDMKGLSQKDRRSIQFLAAKLREEGDTGE